MNELKFIDEYRDSQLAKKYLDKIFQITTRPWKIMEACGGQTHTIVKYGIDQLLPAFITLVHGPGCPVCVTPVSKIDAAIELVLRFKVILCSFGDMLRVPGTSMDLLRVKAQGGDVRVVYSPLDAIRVAKENPTREVVFFAIGFETTAPANAMVADLAKKQGIQNFSLLVAQVLVPPALAAILSSTASKIDAFLAPGHVCTVVGYEEYEALVQKYKIPIVVTGFEPIDILQGIIMCIDQLENGKLKIENQYTRSVKKEGNLIAKKKIFEIFDVTHQTWRGLGNIEWSGLKLSENYRDLDSEFRFHLSSRFPQSENENSDCISGLILQGVKKPLECQQFGKRCHPDHPLGATMVSSEGACAAYFRYRGLFRHE